MSTKALSAKTVVRREIEPLGHGAALHTDPTTVSLSEVVVAYAVLNHVEKVIDKRKKELKPHLMKQAEAHGSLLEKGHRALEVGQEKLTRERKLSAGPNEDKLKLLMETKSIALLEAFDEVKAVVLNPSKLEYLVQVGKLKADEVEALRDESFALSVEAGPELKELLIEACKALEEKDEAPAAKKRARR